ncbi:MAG: methyltransferase domain-containing protein [Deltaproteobacteria bacterium]|nr:methyltransferase domain-containing protein [Deltaproteobacteria bacterium]
MKSYAWDAKDYEKRSSAQQSWARELIDKLKLRGDEHVLDIGSGDGKVTAELSTHVPKGAVVGIDSSGDMTKLAREKFPESRFPNLKFQRADARNLKFENAFDLVFSNATLHWVLDHTSVIEGIKQSLRPGGRVLLQMGGKGNAAEIIRTVEGRIKRDKWCRYFADFTFPYGFYTPEEYEPWLKEAGLVPVRVELIEKDMTQEGPEGLSGWIRTTWLPYTQRVPEDERTAFTDEIVENYLKQYPLDAEGRAHVQMVRLEVEAKKK